MANITPTTQDGFQPLFDLSIASRFVDAVLDAQRLQYEAVLAWQQSVAAFQKELWDEWVCRWAGGVPIDA